MSKGLKVDTLYIYIYWYKAKPMYNVKVFSIFCNINKSRIKNH